MFLYKNENESFYDIYYVGFREKELILPWLFA